MNNIRNDEQLARGWLKVDKVREQNDRVVVRGVLFDNSLFEFTIANHQLELQEGASPLVLVSIVGSVGHNYTEVMLPAPTLNYGYNVRVKPESVINWELYNLKKVNI